jgi:hypothetical protein
MRNRRDLEYEYLALTYQIAHLMESRQRDCRSVQEMETLLAELVRLRSRNSYDSWQADLNRILEVVLTEAESVIRLAYHAAPYREQFRALQGKLSELGQALGYH